MAAQAQRARLLADADLCVKCGLCLPHCPTYRETLDENESPRGRISLLQGWALGRLPLTPTFRQALDDCLLCRNCEAVCPARVPYAGLVDGFRSLTGEAARPFPTRAISSLLRTGLRHPALARLGRRLIEGSHPLLPGSRWQRMVRTLPPLTDPRDWYGHHPARGKALAHVSLFLGCTASVADANTVMALLDLLPRLGVSITVPETQGCCGALDLHAGKAAQAARSQTRNLAAFSNSELDAILTFASGCGATLSEYGTLGDTPEAHSFARRVFDVSQFLAEHVPADRWDLAPLEVRVLIHHPCSLRNVLKTEGGVEGLLRRIPGISIRTLPGKGHCCGAAGAYMVENPDMAERVRADSLAAIAEVKPDFLLTSNIGCALHLRAGLPDDVDLPVLHPIQLLARLQRH
jgi:glycolate oxidase iron-sulfur subunit